MGSRNEEPAAARIAAAFRALPVPVIGRVREGAFIMDLRCLDHEDEFVAQLGQLKIEEKLRHEGHEGHKGTAKQRHI